MAKMGKFLSKRFLNKQVEFYMGDTAEWLQYAENNSMSYAIIVGVLEAYDEEDGVITLKVHTGHSIYIDEESISSAWEANKGFNMLKVTKSTIRSGKDFTKQNRDIM